MKFDDTEIEEYEFHPCKSHVSINNTDINKTVAPNKFSFGKQDFKYFIGSKNNKKVKPLSIFFRETNVYRIDLDETEYLIRNC